VVPVTADTPGAKKVCEESPEFYLFDRVGTKQVAYRLAGCFLDYDARACLAAYEKAKAEGGDPLAALRALAPAPAPAGGGGPGPDAPGVLDALAAYLAHLEREGRKDQYRREIRRRVEQFVAWGGYASAAEFERDRLLEWVNRPRKGKSARAREAERQSVCYFTSWLAKRDTPGSYRLSQDPLAGMEKIKGRQVRPRRALTLDELQRLLKAARHRPLDNHVARSGRARGASGPASVSEGYKAKLLLAGEARALFYKFLVFVLARYTAVRKLQVKHLRLDAERPHAVFPGETTKGGRTLKKRLAPGLAAELKAWVEKTGRRPEDPVFDLPKQPNTRELRKDLEAAGLAYRDEAGEVFDLHSFKRTGITLLARAGVPVDQLQQHAEHTDVRLTLEVYNRVQAEDLDALVRALPVLE
jgi:integrase